MRFVKFAIENFGPYLNREEIDFTDRNGVNIIWADNGRGKTTIMKAFNFLFFGNIESPISSHDDYFSYVNTRGIRNGKYDFYTELTLFYEDDIYIITRKCVAKHGVTIPESSADMVIELYVNFNGNILATDEAERLVRGIMPEEISRFFLFDAEMLQDYSVLLRADSGSGNTIKEAIEKILGLPILTNGAADAKKIRSKYEEEENAAEKQDKRTAELGVQKGKRLEDKKLQEQELEGKKQQQQDLLDEMHGIDAEMQKVTQLKALLDKKNRIHEEIERTKGEIAFKKSEIVELLKGAWKWFLKSPVQSTILALQAEVSTLSAKQASAKDKKVIIDYMRQAVETGTCPVCDHEATSSEKDRIHESIKKIEAGIKGLSDDESAQLHQNTQMINGLQMLGLNEDHLDVLVIKCKELNSLQIKLDDLQDNQLVSAIAAMAGNTENDEDHVRDLTRRSLECEQKLAVVANGIKGIETEIQKLEDMIKALSEQIKVASKGTGLGVAQAKVRFAQGVEEIFTEAVGTYREQRRQKVEKDATDLFMKMSTEEDYDSLKINSNYGLEIMRGGKPVPHRSAGWEQIVAFALIGALHRNAPLEGPVIMDSTFNRYSSNNKKKIISVLPELSDQVLLLANIGEIDASAARKDLGHMIVQEMTLNRIDSEHTTIDKGAN